MPAWPVSVIRVPLASSVTGMSRNCGNEHRPDVDEAWFVAVNFMARPLAPSCEPVSHPEQMPRVLESAFRLQSRAAASL